MSPITTEKHIVRYQQNVYSLAGFPGDHITRMWWQQGTFYEADLLHEIAQRKLAGVYLDVGAHVGNHTVFFAHECPATHVVAFEVNPDAHHLLAQNVCSVHRKGPLIDAYLGPVGNGERVVLEAALPGNTGARCVVEVADETRFAGTMLAIKLDAYFASPRVQGPIALIKIDVEGFEPQVLLGAEALLRRWRPVLVMEARTAEARAIQAATLDRLGLTYTCESKAYCATPTYIWSPQK